MSSQNEQLMKELRSIDGLTELPLETLAEGDYNDILSASEKEVLKLLDLTAIDTWAESLKFEDIMKLTFPRAEQIIDVLSLKRRIELLDSLDVHLRHCYSETEKYTHEDLDIRISPKTFQLLLGKIKHIEILRNWLFGIK